MCYFTKLASQQGFGYKLQRVAFLWPLKENIEINLMKYSLARSDLVD